MNFSFQFVCNIINFVGCLTNLESSSRAGKKSKSMKDFLASSGGSSPVRERASLSLLAVKSLVLRDKEDKLTSEFSKDEKVLSLIRSLFDAGTCLFR